MSSDWLTGLVCMMHAAKMNKSSCFAVGLMSGTSLDGVDACVVEITEQEKLAPKLCIIGFSTHPYSEILRADLRSLCVSGSVSELCRYNALLGEVFASAALEVVSGCGLTMNEIAVIGSHGQTVHHLPSPTPLHGHMISSTLQIGDPSIIANCCRVMTVGDFRCADMAVGGQGAPLVPYLDNMILRGLWEETGRIGLLLNIGGISNISSLVPQSGSASGEETFKLLGFDCGPGNVLIDILMKRWFARDYDCNGEMALSGETSQELLSLLLRDEFVHKQPPKSTGREHYGEEFIDGHLTQMNDITKENVLATLSEFTAAAVWTNYQLFVEPQIKSDKVAGFDLFVSGGGAKNAAIMRALEKYFRGFSVSTTKELGIDPDAKEALCFALLGYQTWKGRPTNMPSVTGAREKVILGKICPSLASKQTVS